MRDLIASIARTARGKARIAALAALALALFVPAMPAVAATLLMLERPGCIYCARFNAEIAPAYPKSEEGKRAVLRRVDITEPWPSDLAGIDKDIVTPTFVLVDDGREVARLRGYPGDNFFWPLLANMLQKLPN